jgi:hypothetical protein
VKSDFFPSSCRAHSDIILFPSPRFATFHLSYLLHRLIVPRASTVNPFFRINRHHSHHVFCRTTPSAVHRPEFRNEISRFLMQDSTLLNGIAPNCVQSGSNFMKIYHFFSRRTTLDAWARRVARLPCWHLAYKSEVPSASSSRRPLRLSLSSR